ncbi:MAG: DNA repair protein RecN [Clostridia bacterium]|nr:DNA repair protein RecN [Clostridia bacterium]
MLQKLTIQNAALIERAELTFAGGLNVLSGETGAGKSVILDCIDFVLGAKADREMVRTGAAECRVTAEFSPVSPRVAELLDELDIESEDTLILSRRLSAEGKGSLKINGNTVTAAMLRRVTANLVEVHGQSEHFSLLKESNQLALLDEIAGESLAEKKRLLASALADRRTILSDLKKLGGDAKERERRIEILRYQIDEIEKIAPKEGEEEELSALLSRYANAEKILSGLTGAENCITSDGGAADAVSVARRSIGSLARYDERYAQLAERLENAVAELSDIADTAQNYADELDIDEREAQRAQTRYDEIKTLKKKYGSTVKEVLGFLLRAKEEYELLSDSGERYEMLTNSLSKSEDKLYDLACEMDEMRRQTAKTFSARVTEELKTLNIASARFEIAFEPFDRADAEKTGADGLGGVKYLFSANAGEPPKELGKIISGGEMSRFMLAVKAQLSGGEGVGTYLFDEIDAGISGNTARVVAEKFMKIAKFSQIIAVTHSAQIAASADRSFLIEKIERNGRACTDIYEIEGQRRVFEVARLIGQAESEFARKHAEELLLSAAQYKKTI